MSSGARPRLASKAFHSPPRMGPRSESIRAASEEISIKNQLARSRRSFSSYGPQRKETATAASRVSVAHRSVFDRPKLRLGIPMLRHRDQRPALRLLAGRQTKGNRAGGHKENASVAIGEGPVEMTREDRSNASFAQ